MSPEDFIRKHIIAALVGEGFPESVARGAEHGLGYYRRSSQAGRKGAIFDDCLFRARQWAIARTTCAERKATKKKPGRAKVPTRPVLTAMQNDSNLPGWVNSWKTLADNLITNQALVS